jgi:hypothetical protein
MAVYRVRTFSGVTRRETSRKNANSTEEAVRESLATARAHRGDYVVAQSTRADKAGILTEAYLVRYQTATERAAARHAAAVDSEEDLLIAVMSLIPGPWSGPGYFAEGEG